jgi:hypothetical protein
MRGSSIIVALLLLGSTAVAQPGPTPGPTPTAPPDEEPPVPDTPTEPEPPPPPEMAPVAPSPPQPAPPAAAPVAVETPAPAPETGYPLALPLRPLALPSGMFEITASGQLIDAAFFDEDPIDALVGVRAGLGIVELEAGATIHVRDASDSDELGLVRGAVRYVVRPNLTVGVEGQVFNPTMDPTQIIVTPGVGYKLRLSDAAAVETRGGLGYMHISFGGESESVISLVGSGKLQIAASRQLSAEFTTDLYIYVSTPEMFGYPYTQMMHGLRGLFTANKHLDIFTGLQVTGFQEFSTKYVTLGVQGRLP